MLMHVMRAEKLGKSASRDEAVLEALRKSGDLSQVRAESGANMLLVYLLARWGRLGSQAGAITPESEPFHEEVVDAYLAAGCAADQGAPPAKLALQMPPGFRNFVKLRGKQISPVSFVQAMLDQIHPDMFPDASAQLRRLAARLSGGRGGEAKLAAASQALSDARVLLMEGTRGVSTIGADSLATLREAATAHGLVVVLGGDEGNLPSGAEVEVVVGRVIASASSEDDAPRTVPRFDDASLSTEQRRFLESRGAVGVFLVATGPLASGALVRGTVASDQGRTTGGFFVGATVKQKTHALGVRGECVAKASWSPRPCTTPWSEDLHLVAQYD